MPAKCHHVQLNESQHDHLKALITSGTALARKLTRVLLKADAGALGPAYTNKQIQEALEVSLRMIERTLKAFALEGLEAALISREQSGTRMPKKFDGQTETHLIALVCSAPSEGAARWTLRLLAEKTVELEHVSSVSHERIRRRLQVGVGTILLCVDILFKLNPEKYVKFEEKARCSYLVI